MLTKQQINRLISEISIVDTKEANDALLRIADIIAQRTEAKYAEISYVNSSRTLAKPHAGSGKIWKIISAHGRAWYLKVHNTYLEQVGPVVVLGKVRIVDWKLGEITEYYLPPGLSNPLGELTPIIVANSPPLFFSPEVPSEQEVYLPIRSGNENVGALALYFDDSVISSNEEIYLLQTVADFIGNFVNYKDYQTD